MHSNFGQGLAFAGDFAHYPRRRQDFAMRKRAIAIAVAEQKARESRMMLPLRCCCFRRFLLLLLISP
jgi:hypothetical protein